MRTIALSAVLLAVGCSFDTSGPGFNDASVSGPDADNPDGMVALPDADPTGTLIVRGPDGAVAFWQKRVAGEHWTGHWAPQCAVGPHRVEYTGDSGRRYEARFTNASLDPNQTPVEVTLEPAR